MKKILSSKLFVALTPIIVLVIGVAASILLGFQPNVSGKIGVGGAGGTVSTQYDFSWVHASGYCLLAVVLAIITLLICLVLRKQYIFEERSAL